jgi:hypothetical protein
MQPVGGGPIKIGCSANVESRHKQLEAHYGCPLVLLAVLDGGRETEKAIHTEFQHLRLGRSELFQPEPELMDFIGRPLFVNQGDVELSVPRSVDVIVKIDRTIMDKVRFIASRRRVRLSDYLSDLLRKPVDAEFSREVQEMYSGSEECP